MEQISSLSTCLLSLRWFYSSSPDTKTLLWLSFLKSTLLCPPSCSPSSNPPVPNTLTHIHSHRFSVSLYSLQIFVLAWWRKGKKIANGGRKSVCVAQSLDEPVISRLEVVWQPKMHLWSESFGVKLRWGGCGMWVTICVGKWGFRKMLMKPRRGGFSSCAAVPESSLTFASPGLLKAETHVRRHVTQTALFRFKAGSVADKESVWTCEVP